MLPPSHDRIKVQVSLQLSQYTCYTRHITQNLIHLPDYLRKTYSYVTSDGINLLKSNLNPLLISSRVALPQMSAAIMDFKKSPLPD